MGHILSGDVELGTDQTKRITADIDRALPSLGVWNRRFRLNLMGHDSKFAGRDIAENRRFGIAPLAGLRTGHAHQADFQLPAPGRPTTHRTMAIPWLFKLSPAPVDRRKLTMVFETWQFI